MRYQQQHHPMSELALALQEVEATPPELDAAFSAWYPELKKIAHMRLMQAGLRGSVQTTSLVHDSYLKLADGAGVQVGSRLQFLAYASRTLRSLIIDQVREQRALRRGGDLQLLTLDTAVADGLGADLDIERVHAALDELAALDPVLSRLVELRFFGGLTGTEIGDLLGLSERTVQREWRKARALLLTLLEST
jgi:RNA polymerase sigma factor (TIGR02999 family)